MRPSSTEGLIENNVFDHELIVAIPVSAAPNREVRPRLVLAEKFLRQGDVASWASRRRQAERSPGAGPPTGLTRRH